MNSESNRSYRKKLITNGLIYMNGEELEVSVVNMSMTGVLVQFNHETDYSETAEKAFKDSSKSKIIDFYLPQLRLAGNAEIIRVSKDDMCVSMALRFKDVTYNIDNLLYKRKVYRKNMAIAGRILLHSKYYHFHTVNVSVEGLMVRLEQAVSIVEGTTTTFEFDKLGLKGEVEIIWTDFDENDYSLIGLKYIHLNAETIKGIPRFEIDTD